MGISVDGEDIYMVLELCSGGSLDKQFKKGKLTPKRKLKIIDGIAKGVAHLHKQKVVHRDIAARNVLLREGSIL